MGKCVFADGTVIEDYKRPYIVAEVNSSHGGDVKIAEKMIEAAAAAGCNGVKFQSFTTESLYSKVYYQKNPIVKRLVKKFSLSASELALLAGYSKEKCISFSSTPYSKDEVDFLVNDCHAPYVKISSMELNNPTFLAYIAKTGSSIVLSTGMGTIDEIKNAVQTLEENGGKQIVLLHCVSNYPAKVEDVNLNNIILLRENFPKYPIGFSDHTEGDEAAIAAVALGAAFIEKHLTLDKSKIGMDNNMATEPEAMAELIRKCRQVQLALGSIERIVSTKELEQRKTMRRSLVAARNLSKGSVLTFGDFSAKRPGDGISPDKIDILVGKKLIRDIDEDMQILPNDVE